MPTTLVEIGSPVPTGVYIRLSNEERVLLGYEWTPRERFSPWQFRCHLASLTLLVRGAITVEEMMESCYQEEELEILRCPRCLCTCQITPEGMQCMEPDCGWQSGDPTDQEED
jgi:hypothetical protein